MIGSFEEDSDEESGKDWDELEEEARRGERHNHSISNSFQIFIALNIVLII